MDVYGPAKCTEHDQKEWALTNTVIFIPARSIKSTGAILRITSNGKINHHCYCINGVGISWKYLSKYE